MNEIRVRVAPSPTGVPHIGTTRTSLFNWLFARHHDGKFIVRIEDTDRQRYVPESMDKILEILKWLGLTWDEGPKIGGEYGPYIQSERLELYKKAAQELIDKDSAYYCFCSASRLEKMRAEQEKKGLPPKYDRHCLNISRDEAKKRIDSGESYVIRLKVPDKGKTSWKDLIHNEVSFDNKQLDDQVLLKSDGFPTYHLAVVVDDHAMKITHVLRGDEWVSSTPKHLLLYQAFGWTPPEFGHLPLVLGPDKAKLSKRHGAKSVLEYRDEGYLAEALINAMAFWGWTPKGTKQEIFAPEELVKKFSLKDVNATSPIFSLEKLNWFNGQWIRKLSAEELLKRLQEIGYRLTDKGYLAKVLPLIQDRMVTLRDFDELTNFFFEEPTQDAKLLTQKGKTEKEAGEALTIVDQKLESLEIEKWNAKDLEKISHDLVKQTSWKIGDLFMTIRIALTGKTATPPLFETMEVLGPKTTLSRLQKAISVLK